jgi:hypothetical protein
MRLHLIPIKWLLSRKQTTNTDKDEGVGALYTVGKNVNQYGVSPKNLKIQLLYDPVIPLLSIYQKESKSAYKGGIYQLRGPSMDKENVAMYVHTHTHTHTHTQEYYSAIKKNKIVICRKNVWNWRLSC